MRSQKGQSLVEYAVIGGGILILLLISVQAIQPLLASNMESTRKGLDTPVISP